MRQVSCFAKLLSSHKKQTYKSMSKGRHGSILILSLVLIALFSVIAYMFSVNAGLDLRQSKGMVQISQQRLLTESALVMVQNSRNRIEGITDWDRIVALPDSQGRIHRIGIQLPFSSADKPRFGLFNESAKLNLNYLASTELSREAALEKLLRTPGLSRATAEAILDYVRSGVKKDGSTQFGIRDLSELLGIPGVTVERLFGKDSNRDGMVDPHEWATSGRDIRPGLREASLGWSGYWTTIAGESTLRRDGKPKIRLNQKNLAKLYDELIEIVTPEEAQFLIAWRLAPAKYPDDRSRADIQVQKRKALLERESSFAKRMLEQTGSSLTKDANRFDQDTERAGIRFGSVEPIRIPSLIALCQCSVQISVRGEDRVLLSPFPSTITDVVAWLQRWEELTTLSDDEVDVTRINIQHASKETLQTVMGMSESLAHSIVSTRDTLIGSQEVATTAWLLTRGLVNWHEYRAIASEITTGGSVYSGIAIGQLEHSRFTTRIYFILDQRYGAGQWIYRRELEPIPALLHQFSSVGQTR